MITTATYELATNGTCTISMPEGAQILCVYVETEQPFVCALIDNERPVEDRGFCVVHANTPFNYFPYPWYVGHFKLNEVNCLVFQSKK